MTPIRAADIERWAADSLDARGLFPELVRRLVHGTATGATRVEFPADLAVGRPGWDGTVVTSSGNAFVPAGRSRWEMGVDASPRDKANRDHIKRTARTAAAARTKSHYLFVTPRVWRGKPNKEEWAEQRSGDGWRSVRVLDADDLEQWLEVAPAARIWFGRRLGRDCSVVPLSDHFAGLAALTDPPIPPEVWLAGRPALRDRVDQFLKAGPASLAAEIGAAGDGFDALCAAVSVAGRADRAVVVQSTSAWESVRFVEGPLVMLLKPGVRPDPAAVREATAAGHHVLRAAAEFVQPGVDVLEVPRTRRHDLAAALTEAGFPELKARKLADRSGGSVTVLRFLKSEEADERRPAWADHPAAPAYLLCGGAMNGFPGDDAALRNVAAELGVTAVGDVPAELSRVAGPDEPDPMLLAVGEKWRVLSKLFAWLHVGPSVPTAAFETFLTHAAAALAERDPQLGHSFEERLSWSLLRPDERTDYSPLFREQAADTLAFLAAFRSTLRLPFSDRFGAALSDFVRDALPAGDWERWATLDRALPLLAETAPDAFLDAVGRDLNATPSAADGLFGGSGERGPFGRCEYADLMWALETVAWEPSQLGRVCLLLARLAPLKAKHEVHWGNGPPSSLTAVLCEWLPHTAAAPPARLRAVRRLAAGGGDDAWRAIVSLLERKRSVSSTQRPVWRDWATEQDERRPFCSDAHAQRLAVAGHLLDLAGSDVDRWSDLVDHLFDLPDDVLTDFAEGLRRVGAASTDSDRQPLADGLRKKLDWPRSGDDPFRDHRGVLEAALAACEPRSPAVRHAWLFGHTPHRFMRSGEETWEDAEARHRRAREEALAEVLDAGELEQLIAAAGRPWCVGWSLACRSDGDQWRTAYQGRLADELAAGGERERTAAGFTRCRFLSDGGAWVEGLGVGDWPPEARLRLALALTASVETADRAEGWGVGDGYWAEVNHYGFREDAETVRRAVRQLTAADRAGDAVQLLAHADVPALTPEETEEYLNRAATAGGWSSDHPGYDVGKLLDRLREADVPAGRIARLQFLYQPALSGSLVEMPELRSAVVTSPDLLLELIAFLSPRREGGVPHPTERLIASLSPDRREGLRDRAYRLLHDREHGNDSPCPGFVEGRADPAVLNQWISDVRELGRRHGWAAAVERTIGELLSRSPAGDDGAWPHEAVREVIEDAEETLHHGFYFEHRNSRGCTMRAVDEGGKQEEELAARYNGWAETVRPGWPRTAGLLEMLSRSYRSDAARHDEDATWEFS